MPKPSHNDIAFTLTVLGAVNDTPVFQLERLDVGDAVEGPAMIIDTHKRLC